jgi:hypothetical protein
MAGGSGLAVADKDKAKDKATTGLAGGRSPAGAGPIQTTTPGPGDAAFAVATQVPAGSPTGGPPTPPARTAGQPLAAGPSPGGTGSGSGSTGIAKHWHGETVHKLADSTFFNTSVVKHLDKQLDKIKLIDVPIPDLGVRVGVGVDGRFGFDFLGSFTSRLENASAEFDWDQERKYEFEEAGADAALVHWDPRRVAELSSALGPFDGGADLIVSVHLLLHAWAEVGVSVGASLAGAFDVASLGTGLSANLRGEFKADPRLHLDLHYRDGNLNFAFGAPLEADLSLAGKLESFVRASLLGFTWRKNWTLAERSLDRHWSTGYVIGFDSGNALPAALHFAERANDLLGLLRMLLDAGDQPAKLTQDPVASGTPGALPPGGGAGGGGGTGGGAPTGPGGAGGGGGSGGAGGGAGGGGGGAASNLPTGRYESDPIPMTWYKPPGLYHSVIQLDSGQYWLTEPGWLKVPPDRGFSDVRRQAQTDPDGDPAVRIGVPVRSKFFPVPGRVWPRVQAGVIRTGVVQAQFRRLLRAHAYAWGTEEADHVRDLQWAGEDDYQNLWPLERAYNGAANYILEQPVSYQTRQGVARANVPLRTTERGLYFRIVRILRPP